MSADYDLARIGYIRIAVDPTDERATEDCVLIQTGRVEDDVLYRNDWLKLRAIMDKHFGTTTVPHETAARTASERVDDCAWTLRDGPEIPRLISRTCRPFRAPQSQNETRRLISCPKGAFLSV